MKIETMYATVIAADTQNFSKTHVYGGGNAYSSRINSSVTDHQVDHIWVKNHTLGREEKLSFQDERVDARAGHRLVLVRAYVKSGAYEARVYNVDTGVSYKTFLGAKEEVSIWNYTIGWIPLLGWLVVMRGSSDWANLACNLKVNGGSCITKSILAWFAPIVKGLLLLIMIVFLGNLFPDASKVSEKSTASILLPLVVTALVYLSVPFFAIKSINKYAREVNKCVIDLDDALANGVGVARKDSSVFGS